MNVKYFYGIFAIMRKFKPRCVADMKDPKCHFYIRIYEKSVHMDNKDVTDDLITVNKGFQARFIREVEAEFIEWGYSEYRIAFPFDGEGSYKPWNLDYKILDIRYSDRDDVKFKEWGEYVFVLIIKAEKGLKSQCI